MSYVNCRVKCLHSTSKHLRRVGNGRDILNLQISLTDHLRRSSGGNKPDGRLVLFICKEIFALPDASFDECIREIEKALWFGQFL